MPSLPSLGLPASYNRIWNGRRAAPRAEVEWRYADRHAPAEGDPAGHPERQADGHHGGAGSEPRPGEPRGAAEGRGLRLPPLLPAQPAAVPAPRGHRRGLGRARRRRPGRRSPNRYPALPDLHPRQAGRRGDGPHPDLATPDWGDRRACGPGDVPVFGACGVTPQAVALASKPPFMITPSPGHMFITDLPNSALAAL